MAAWRVYYRGGRVFDSLDGGWADAPADGVLAVLWRVGDRTEIASGGDYYRLTEHGEVVCHETADAILHAVGRTPLGPILHGWCVGPSEMNQVLSRANADRKAGL